MTTVILPQGKTRTSTAASATVAAPLGNINFSTGTDNIYTARSAGTFSNLYYRVVSNNRGASTFRVRVNGANGNLLISVGASTTGEFEDNTNTDTVSVGDEVNLQEVIGAGGTTYISTVCNCLFNATTNTVLRFGATDHDNVSTASTTFFYSIGGRISTSNATASTQQVELKTAGTIRNMGCRVLTNARTTSTAVGLYINAGVGNCLITCTASTTGTFEDTVNSDSVSVDDDICFYITTGTGTGNFRVAQGIWGEMETTNDKWQIFAGQAGGNPESTFNAAATHYLAFGGQISNDFTTETDTSIDAQLPFTASNLQIRLSANTATNDSTLRLRKNQASANQVVTITGLTSGLFQDTSNNDSIIATDEINYQLVVGSGGTSVVLTGISVLCTSHRRLLQLLGVS